MEEGIFIILENGTKQFIKVYEPMNGRKIKGIGWNVNMEVERTAIYAWIFAELLPSLSGNFVRGNLWGKV